MFYFCTKHFFHNLMERANVFLFIANQESGGTSDIFFFTQKIFIE